MNVGVAGPRSLTEAQTVQAVAELKRLLPEAAALWVGDATGLDTLAYELAIHEIEVNYFQVNWRIPGRARYAERTTRMIKALTAHQGVLHAWINRSCPAGLNPGKSWGKAQGSGTWGAVAIAVGHGIPVVIHLFEDLELPGWLVDQELEIPLLNV